MSPGFAGGGTRKSRPSGWPILFDADGLEANCFRHLRFSDSFRRVIDVRDLSALICPLPIFLQSLGNSGLPLPLSWRHGEINMTVSLVIDPRMIPSRIDRFECTCLSSSFFSCVPSTKGNQRLVQANYVVVAIT